MGEAKFLEAVNEAIKGDHNDLRREALILHAFREAADPQSSADHHQRQGIALDIIDEALQSYTNFMLDDDFEPYATLRKIMERMQARRDWLR